MASRRRLVVLGIILGIPCVLAVVLLLYVNFADLSGWRDTVGSVASDAIGRELKINGEFTPRVGFSTRVVATDITLASPAWSEDPHMVSVDRLAGEIDLLSIFSPPLTLRDVEIERARVFFAVDPEEGFNWAFDTGEPIEDLEPDSGDFEMVIENAALHDVMLEYTPDRGTPIRAEVDLLEITDDGTGMLDLDLDGTLMDRPLEISGRLGTLTGLINANQVQHDLRGNLGETEFALVGSIDDLGSLTGVDATASITGSSLDEALGFLNAPPLSEQSFRASFTASPTKEGSKIELDARVGEITVEATGLTDSLTSPKQLGLAVDASGPDIRTVGGLAGLDVLPYQDFSVSGRLGWQGFPITIEDLDVRVGANTFEADGVLGRPPLMLETDFRFAGEGSDFSALAALAGLAVPADPYSIRGRVLRVERGLQIEEMDATVGDSRLAASGLVGDPPNYTGTDLRLDASVPRPDRYSRLVGRQLPALPLRVEGRLVEGTDAIRLDGVAARLGDHRLTVDGTLSTVAGLTGSDLRIHSWGTDLSEPAAFAGMEDVPAHSYDVSGQVRLNASAYLLSGVEAALGDISATASGRVSRRTDLVNTSLAISGRGPDLDHLGWLTGLDSLPRGPFEIGGTVEINQKGYRLTGMRARVGEITANAEGLISNTSGLEGSEVQADIRGPSLKAIEPLVGDQSLPPEAFRVMGSFAVRDGLYHFSDTEFELGSTRATIDGTLGIASSFEGTELQLTLADPSMLHLSKMIQDAGVEGVPDFPDEPFSVAGGVRRHGDGWMLGSVAAHLAETNARLHGRIGAPPDYRGTDLTIDASGPEAAFFNPLLGVAVPAAPFRIAGRVERTRAGFHFFETTARFGDYHLSIDGSLGDFPKLIGTDLEIHTSGPGTGPINQLIEGRGLPNQPFRLDGQFTGTPERFAARDFNLTFGPSDLMGSFSVDITGKPDLRARLTSTHIDLRHLRERHEKTDTVAENVTEAPPPTPASQNLLIPDEPFDLALLQKADADVTLRIDEVILPTNRLHHVAVDLRLEGGRLEIERIAAGGDEQQSATGSLVLEPVGDRYRLKTALEMRSIRLDVPGTAIDPSEQPPIDIDVNFEALGATPHELAASSNGSLQLVVGKGIMDNRVLDLVTADILLTLLDAFNPFAGEKAATELQCAVFLVSLENGLATFEPMALQSDTMTMLGRGKIDLGTEKLNLEWVTKPRKGIGLSASMITNPYIKLGGTLGNPGVELKPIEAVASTGVAVATMGISLVAKGMLDRVTAEKKVCKKALREIAARAGDPPQKTKRKK